jgi:peptidoglycan/LPS O-acetylase OafA/YrhL
VSFAPTDPSSWKGSAHSFAPDGLAGGSNGGSAGRVPSLDGLRALAMLGVILVHLEGTRGVPGWLAGALAVSPFDIEQLRVRVFFILSGFLITTILMREVAKTGAVRLPRFYFRRLLRIVPPLLVFLAAVVAGSAAGLFDVTGRDLVQSATFTVNYLPERSWSVGHLWALAVEEQFYVLWPPVLVLAGAVWGRRVALAALLTVPVLRLSLALTLPEYRPFIGYSFETSADALAIGCVLALERDRLYAWPWLRRIIDSRWILPVAFVAGVIVSWRYRPALLVGVPLQNLALALGIERCTRRPDGLVGRFLHLRPLVFVATTSYSLYLWQQLFLQRDSEAWWTAFPQNLVLVAIFGLASYYFVERPVLRARSGLEGWLFASTAVRGATPLDRLRLMMHVHRS